MRRHVPRLATVAYIAHSASFFAAVNLASIRVVLPFLYVAMAGPVVLAGLFYPLSQVTLIAAGILIAPFVSLSQTRYAYLVACAGLVLAIALLAAAVDLIRPGGWVVPVFVVYSLVFGACVGIQGLARKSILSAGWTKKERAPLIGVLTSTSGLVAVSLMGLTAILATSGEGPGDTHQTMLMLAGISALCAGVFAFGLRGIEGPAKQRPPDRPPYWSGIATGFRSLSRQGWFVRLTLARILLISVEQGAVFYAIHAARVFADRPQALPVFTALTAAGGIVGGLIAAWAMRRREKNAIIIGGILGVVATLLALAIEFVASGEVEFALAAVMFLLLGIGGSCIGAGRLAYFLTSVSDRDRENGIALNKLLAESAAAVTMLALGTVAAGQSVIRAVVVLGVAAIGGVALSLTLPTITRPEDTVEKVPHHGTTADQARALDPDEAART